MLYVELREVRKNAVEVLKEVALEELMKRKEEADRDYKRGVKEAPRGRAWALGISMDIIKGGESVGDIINGLLWYLERADEKLEVETGNDMVFWEGAHFGFWEALKLILDIIWGRPDLSFL